MYPKINVNTNQLNKVLKEIGIHVERVAFDRLQEAADRAKDAAQEGFRNAKYDGVNDVLVFTDSSMYSRTVEVMAAGTRGSAAYIEYGTGLQGGANPGYINGSTGRDYWYFSDRGGDVQLTAGGTNAENSWYRTTVDVEAAVYEYQKGLHSYRISEDDVRMGKGGLYYVDDAGRKYAVTETVEEEDTRREDVDPYKVYGDPKYKEHSFITHGNPPNHIMRHAKHEAARVFVAYYKSKYSKR